MKKIIMLILTMLLSLSMSNCNVGNLPNLPNSPSLPTENAIAIQLIVGENNFAASFYESETSKDFIKLLPLTLDMKELNGNEKYFYLEQNFPTQPQKINNIKAGDIMLYGSNCLVLFYESFATSYSYTKLGFVNNVDGLKQSLGKNDVKVNFSIKE